MTHTKKTLGCNWTRYHNYYGMNRILEAVCTKRLHWDREALRDYTINHAPEVNYQNAMPCVMQRILPLCQTMMMMPGSRVIQSYRVAARPHISSHNPRPKRRRRRARKHKAVGRIASFSAGHEKTP